MTRTHASRTMKSARRRRRRTWWLSPGQTPSERVLDAADLPIGTRR